MSRSRKKPIVKDRPRNGKKSTEYWRTVRATQNQFVRKMTNTGDYDIEIPHERIIYNDYDYSDYEFYSDSEKAKRK